MTNSATGHEPELKAKVLAWLETEGFPTEFRAAMAFRAARFHARQGFHYRTEGLPREIDVVGTRTLYEDELFVRCEFVVECKYTSKPWVVFTDKYSSISPSACITQTMGSDVGSALLWTIAGATEIHCLKMFSTPEMAGFGGRQAFSKGDDQFFKAMAAVTSAASALASRYDSDRELVERPENAACVFPIIVVEGSLFQSFYDRDSASMKVEPADYIRCHWKGAPNWELHASIDVVTLEGLPKYLAELGPSVDTLLCKMMTGLKDLRRAFETGSLAPLNIQHGSRGTVGLPPVLAAIVQTKSKGDPSGGI